MARVSTQTIVETARKMLAKSENQTCDLSDIANACGCGIIRTRNAIESHGYEFSFNVAIGTNNGWGSLPMSDWEVEWHQDEMI